ncbi:MAG: hypothetical protein LBV44_00310 [Methylobacillus sp.]|jgi:hypothetical protein|nr:hypothetical protein [Methylobacillus sp.]
MPPELQQAIADARAKKKGAKKILVLINPPYAEVTNRGNVEGSSKAGVTKTRFAEFGMEGYGKATNELFTQFVARIYKEIPGATLAMFSPLKYINTQTLGDFREKWKAEYLGGFVVHSQTFDGLIGNFPIGFLIWNTNKHIPIGTVSAVALDRDGNNVGEKILCNYDGQPLLTDWVDRPLVNIKEVVPLKNAITPATATRDLRGTRWSNGAIAWLNCAGNDLQNAMDKTMLFSSGYGSARGYFVNPENLWKAAIVFAVRMVIPHTWLNHNDQFLQPSQPLTEEFKSDCLVYMLFAGKNLTAGANGLEWNNKQWSLTNHFIPFTETEVSAKGRFESSFMSDYIAKLKLSAEARAVMSEGKKLWQQYHASQYEKKIRDEYKLNRPDVGWYQIRKALEANNDNEPVDFTPFKEVYDALSSKLRPMVYALGFLR